MAEEESVNGLADLRKKIDALDDALVRLLNARAACALEIGRVKKEAGLPVYQPTREAEVLGHVQEINRGASRRWRGETAVRAHHRRSQAARAHRGRRLPGTNPDAAHNRTKR